jgi:lambda family phage minor tail protein L
MPRDFTDDFVEEKNKQTNRPVHLFKVLNFDGASNNLLYTDHDADITFNSETYYAFPIAFDSVSENSDGSIDSIKLSVSNVNRTIQAYLESYDLRGKTLEIYTVFLDLIADPTSLRKDIFVIDSYATQTDLRIIFNCTSIFDLLKTQIPNQTYSRYYCQYKIFKGTECGYAGAETSCNRTFARCEALNNKSRFGGQPAIPQRRYVV